MNENIDEGFTSKIEELEYGWIRVDGVIYTPNDISGLTAYEVYEKQMKELENPTPQPPTLEEVVKTQADKISILEHENADLLLDSASKDIKIQTIEKDLADLTLEVVIGGM